MDKEHPHFPVGAIIVREKLAAPDDVIPELIAVMIKHEKGYNPQGGDWEYLTYKKSGNKEIVKNNMMKCQKCHNVVAQSDFVFSTALGQQMTEIKSLMLDRPLALDRPLTWDEELKKMMDERWPAQDEKNGERR
jgi:hypothetical protein